MPGPERFRCPACGEGMAPAAYSRHLAERPDERVLVFGLFVADHADATLADRACRGAAEVVPLLEADERVRFGVRDPRCAGTVQRCGCNGSFCAEHAFACVSCGRFACLRHRWSGVCPTCDAGTRAKAVRVEKYDPFSKQRSTFVRKYPRPGGAPPWDRLMRDDHASS